MAETETPQTNAPEKRKISSLSDWKRNKTYTITLPSSTVVEIQIPDLPALVKTGQIPNSLVDIAIGVTQGKRPTRDDIEEQADFYNKLAAITVITPKITEEEITAGAIPFNDKEMIVEFATRQRDMDAIGHHLGGLDQVKEFRTFRGLAPRLEDLEI